MDVLSLSATIGQSAVDASGEMGWLPVAFVIACVIITVLLLVTGFLLWRTMFSEENRLDTAAGIESREAFARSKTEQAPDKTVADLNPKSISASADTVDNQTDEDIVEELNSKLSTQPTVDATGDISVSNDSDEDINVD